MSPAFSPFVIEIEYGSSYVEVEQDWHGDVVAYLYGEKTRAEMLMSQAELDSMYETADEATYWRDEPGWSLRNRSIAERCRLDSERPATPHQIAAE